MLFHFHCFESLSEANFYKNSELAVVAGRQVTKEMLDWKRELATWYLHSPWKIKVPSITWLARNADTIVQQLIFILCFSLLHVKLCLLMTSSCCPHSGLESPFKFPTELLLKSNCTQANTSPWCGQRFNRHEASFQQRSLLPNKH